MREGEFKMDNKITEKMLLDAEESDWRYMRRMEEDMMQFMTKKEMAKARIEAWKRAKAAL